MALDIQLLSSVFASYPELEGVALAYQELLFENKHQVRMLTLEE